MRISRIIAFYFLALIFSSCGPDGDPGHCYFSLDWEYYNEEYGVYYYEDNNPNIPESEDIEPGVYYDCYPGTYEYYYKSEDSISLYSYWGQYTLIQNPGYQGTLFHDGLDGADTYLDLYLYIYARKGLTEITEINNDSVYPFTKRSIQEDLKGEWKIIVEEQYIKLPKSIKDFH